MASNRGVARGVGLPLQHGRKAQGLANALQAVPGSSSLLKRRTPECARARGCSEVFTCESWLAGCLVVERIRVPPAPATPSTCPACPGHRCRRGGVACGCYSTWARMPAWLRQLHLLRHKSAGAGGYRELNPAFDRLAPNPAQQPRPARTPARGRSGDLISYYAAVVRACGVGAVCTAGGGGRGLNSGPMGHVDAVSHATARAAPRRLSQCAGHP
jgi:hypothetical protein